MDAPLNEKPSYHGAVTEHIRLLNFGRNVASELVKDPQIREAAAPILLHQDLHKRNIFVSEKDPSTITGIIDWQSSSINPAFMHANEMPDFAFSIPTPEDLISSEDHIPSEDCILRDDCMSSEDLRARTNARLCNQAFRAGVRFLVPKLYAAWELDDDVTRFFDYCHRTYRDGAAVFRQVLMDLADRWKELALAGSCPYPLPSSEERLPHQDEYQALEHAQEIKKFVTSRLNTAADGWVPAEVWEETVEDYKKLYNEFLKNMSEEDLRKA